MSATLAKLQEGRLHEVRAEYVETRERASALNIAATIGRILERQEKLGDACDEWLRDPHNGEKYFIGPRSEEVWVVYETWEGCPEKALRPRRERALLSTLIAEIERVKNVTVVATESKHADPRKLILEQQVGTIQVVDTVAGLLERAWELQSKMDAAAKIRAMSEAEVRAGLREMLRETCGLSETATDAFLARVERGARERAVAEMQAQLDGEDDEP